MKVLSLSHTKEEEEEEEKKKLVSDPQQCERTRNS